MLRPVNKPPRLRSGNKVHLVSPASTPSPQALSDTVRYLESLGLEVAVGAHALDTYGYLAGTDDDRLADLNLALRDPDAAAVIATRGGKGAYRIADQLDFDAARSMPKLLVGFSEISILQLALLKHANLASLHGAAWSPAFDPRSAQSFVDAAFTATDVCIHAEQEEPTSALTTSGTVSGPLIGGNQDMIATGHGWALPDLDGAILLLEEVNRRLGHLDRQLTRLTKIGALRNIAGIAVGQYAGCGPDATTQGDWHTNDVLRDKLERLGVPILGGLPIGHGNSPLAVPIGSRATLDTAAKTLTVESAVC